VPQADDTWGASLALGHLAVETAVVVCLLVAAHLLRRSELEEIGPLRRSADLDPLTTLHNQLFFRRVASRRIAQAKRHDVPLSLAMLDVDDFEEYNDLFGYEAGNAVLRRVAGVLRRSVRTDDLVARYGGEEFVMLLNSEPREAEEALERIRSRIKARCSPGNGLARRPVTISVGVVGLGQGGRWRGSPCRSMRLCTARRRRARIGCSPRGRRLEPRDLVSHAEPMHLTSLTGDTATIGSRHQRDSGSTALASSVPSRAL
jgi:diguanylate cyclase (GGDEF)-like protein